MKFTTTVMLPVVLMLACVHLPSAVGTRNLGTNEVHVHQVGARQHQHSQHSQTLQAGTCDVVEDRAYSAGVLPVTQLGQGATRNMVSCRALGRSHTDQGTVRGRAVTAGVAAAAASPTESRSGVLLFIVLRSVLLVLMLLLALL